MTEERVKCTHRLTSEQQLNWDYFFVLIIMNENVNYRSPGEDVECIDGAAGGERNY